jgi:hypothetical protein
MICHHHAERDEYIPPSLRAGVPITLRVMFFHHHAPRDEYIAPSLEARRGTSYCVNFGEANTVPRLELPDAGGVAGTMEPEANTTAGLMYALACT